MKLKNKKQKVEPKKKLEITFWTEICQVEFVKSVVTQMVWFIELWKSFHVWPSFDSIMCISGSWE